mgnify:CR=1 FL=1|jgi:hypothetical protein
MKAALEAAFLFYTLIFKRYFYLTTANLTQINLA